MSTCKVKFRCYRKFCCNRIFCSNTLAIYEYWDNVNFQSGSQKVPHSLSSRCQGQPFYQSYAKLFWDFLFSFVYRPFYIVFHSFKLYVRWLLFWTIVWILNTDRIDLHMLKLSQILRREPRLSLLLFSSISLPSHGTSVYGIYMMVSVTQMSSEIYIPFEAMLVRKNNWQLNYSNQKT